MRALIVFFISIQLFNFSNCFKEITINCELINRKSNEVTCINFDLQVSNEQSKVVSIYPQTNDTIVSLHLESNSMLYLPMGIFDFFPQLEDLRIFTEQPSLIQIDGRNFKRIKNLRKIFITNQLLKNLEPKIFIEATKLISLHLPANSIETIHAKTFEGLNECRYLGLNYNKIKELNVDVFSTLPKLMHLNLEYNKIKELPKTIFSNNNNLVICELSGNNLEQIPMMPVKKVFEEKRNSKFSPILTLNDNTCPSLKNIHGKNTERQIMSQHALCMNLPTCMSECFYTKKLRRSSFRSNENVYQTRDAFETIEDIIDEEDKLLSLQLIKVNNIINKLESFLEDNPAEEIAENEDFDMKIIYNLLQPDFNQDFNFIFKQPGDEDDFTFISENDNSNDIHMTLKNISFPRHPDKIKPLQDIEINQSSEYNYIEQESDNESTYNSYEYLEYMPTFPNIDESYDFEYYENLEDNYVMQEIYDNNYNYYDYLEPAMIELNSYNENENYVSENYDYEQSLIQQDYEEKEEYFNQEGYDYEKDSIQQDYVENENEEDLNIFYKNISSPLLEQSYEIESDFDRYDYIHYIPKVDYPYEFEFWENIPDITHYDTNEYIMEKDETENENDINIVFTNQKQKVKEDDINIIFEKQDNNDNEDNIDFIYKNITSSQESIINIPEIQNENQLGESEKVSNQLDYFYLPEIDEYYENAPDYYSEENSNYENLQEIEFNQYEYPDQLLKHDEISNSVEYQEIEPEDSSYADIYGEYNYRENLIDFVEPSEVYNYLDYENDENDIGFGLKNVSSTWGSLEDTSEYLNYYENSEYFNNMQEMGENRIENFNQYQSPLEFEELKATEIENSFVEYFQNEYLGEETSNDNKNYNILDYNIPEIEKYYDYAPDYEYNSNEYSNYENLQGEEYLDINQLKHEETFNLTEYQEMIPESQIFFEESNDYEYLLNEYEYNYYSENIEEESIEYENQNKPLKTNEISHLDYFYEEKMSETENLFDENTNYNHQYLLEEEEEKNFYERPNQSLEPENIFNTEEYFYQENMPEILSPNEEYFDYEYPLNEYYSYENLQEPNEYENLDQHFIKINETPTPIDYSLYENMADEYSNYEYMPDTYFSSHAYEYYTDFENSNKLTEPEYVSNYEFTSDYQRDPDEYSFINYITDSSQNLNEYEENFEVPELIEDIVAVQRHPTILELEEDIAFAHKEPLSVDMQEDMSIEQIQPFITEMDYDIFLEHKKSAINTQEDVTDAYNEGTTDTFIENVEEIEENIIDNIKEPAGTIEDIDEHGIDKIEEISESTIEDIEEITQNIIEESAENLNKIEEFIEDTYDEESFEPLDFEYV